MKTMEKLIARFNRSDDFNATASLDTINSYRGYYVVHFDSEYPFTVYFTTCREFREWMDGVVLD